MTEDNLLIYVLASVVIMLFFGMAVIWFLNQTQRKIAQGKIKEQERELSFQKELLANTIKTQEKERTRIAKELHDDVTSQLSIIHLNMHLLKKKVTTDEELARIIDHIESSLKNSTEKTRTISHELMPAILQKFGFRQALADLSDSVNMTGMLELKVEHENVIAINDSFKLLHIYRILQELINNTLKYAKANNITISFEAIEDQQLQMRYRDDGVGFDTEHAKTGLGMGNINTRIRLLSGSIKFESEKGKGLLVTSKFPNHD